MSETKNTAPSVAVKALEWDGNDYTGWSAYGLGLGYQIDDETSDEECFILEKHEGSSVIKSAHASLNAAQEYAQADYEARIRSALSAQVQDVAGWRPIETAPKDGTPILGGHSEAVLTVWWEADGSQNNSGEPGWVDGSFNRIEENYTYPITHWMPLPAAPAKQEGGPNEVL